MPNKSQYKGTCQGCGAIYKLPNMLLAKHDYQVQWNIFNGTCPGSNHMPFEKNFNLINKLIDDSIKKKDNLFKQIENLNQEPTQAKAWYHECIRKSKGLLYHWRIVELIYINKNDFRFIDINGEEKSLNFYGDCNDVFELAQKLNLKYINHIEFQIKSINKYIDWQQNRVNNWQERDYIPI